MKVTLSRMSGLNEFGVHYGYLDANVLVAFFIRRWVKKHGGLASGIGEIGSPTWKNFFKAKFTIQAKPISRERRKRDRELADIEQQQSALGLVTRTVGQLDLVRATLVDLTPEPESVEPDYIWRDDIHKS
jgi:hypothetical protein